MTVQRVHWLRARAQKERWAEEVTLVAYEMQWTVRYFLYNVQLWEGRRRNSTLHGPASYAARKAAMWHYMALNADRIFRSIDVLYKPLV
jgi:hypothetical protein